MNNNILNNKVVLTAYYKPKPGGLCKRYFLAIEALLGAGYTVHYISYTAFPIQHERCIYHPVTEKHINHIYLYWAYTLVMFSFYIHRLIKEFKPTVFFSFATFYSLCFQMSRWRHPIRNILFLRADGLKNLEIQKKPKWLCWLYKHFEKYAIKHTELVSVSNTLLETTLQRHRQTKPVISHVIHNHIDVIQTRLIPNKSHYDFGCVGVLETRKNQKILIECFKQLPHIHLHLFGTGPDEQSLKTMAESIDNIHFHGWQTPESIYKRIDCLLAPSMHEGISNAILEAISLGTPVLAANIKENTEFLSQDNLVNNTIQSWILKLENINAQSLSNLVEKQSISSQCLRFDWQQSILNFFEQTQAVSKT